MGVLSPPCADELTDYALGADPARLASTLLAKRWTIPILTRLAEGERRFLDLQRQLPGLAHKVLVDHLRVLEKNGLLERTESRSRRRVIYRLTAQGASLLPIIAELRQWRAGGNAE